MTADSPAVMTKLDSDQKAHLTVTALLKNASSQDVTGQLHGKVGDLGFFQEVHLKAGEQKDVVFDPAQFAQLNIDHPRLWWPWQMGSPELNKLSLHFEINGQTSDATETSFGIREVTSELNSAGKRVTRAATAVTVASGSSAGFPFATAGGSAGAAARPSSS